MPSKWLVKLSMAARGEGGGSGGELDLSPRGGRPIICNLSRPSDYTPSSCSPNALDGAKNVPHVVRTYIILCIGIYAHTFICVYVHKLTIDRCRRRRRPCAAKVSAFYFIIIIIYVVRAVGFVALAERIRVHRILCYFIAISERSVHLFSLYRTVWLEALYCYIICSSFRQAHS